MEIRKIVVSEKAEAVELVWNVFMEFETPDYTKEGIETFKEFICNEKVIGELTLYGAFKSQRLIGVIATRNKGNHISLFFVAKQYQKQGIGTMLFNQVINNSNNDIITVNSSPYAVDIYHKLGFVDTNKEQLADGIRYVPMQYKK